MFYYYRSCIMKTLIIAQFIILYFLSISPLFSEIRSSTTKEGTIEYSNSAKKYAPKKNTIFQSQFMPLIERIASEEGVDPYLVKCLIKVESNFSADAVSVAGAMGLMQIMQDIARAYKVTNPFDPEENVKAGTRHLKELLNYFKNDVPLALAAYHAGIGRVKKNMAVPPIKSTVDYVKQIMSYYGNESNGDIEAKVQRLYKRIQKDGTIEIYGR